MRVAERRRWYMLPIAYAFACLAATVFVATLYRDETGDGTEVVYLLLLTMPWSLLSTSSVVPMVAGGVLNLGFILLARRLNTRGE